MTSKHPFYKAIHNNQAILDSLDGAEIPAVESLKTTQERVIPFWEKFIVPQIKKKQKILIVAHGTVLRSLIMHIESTVIVFVLIHNTQKFLQQ